MHSCEHSLVRLECVLKIITDCCRFKVTKHSLGVEERVVHIYRPHVINGVIGRCEYFNALYLMRLRHPLNQRLILSMWQFGEIFPKMIEMVNLVVVV